MLLCAARMKLRLAFALSALVACSSSQNDPQPDAGADCTLQPQVDRARFVSESIGYLRSAFVTTTGFEEGSVAYGETEVLLDDAPCPVADWTALTYTAPIDPARVPIELRATHDKVAVVWALNGRKQILFMPSEHPKTESDYWLYGRLPDGVNAIAKDDADPAAVRDLVAQIGTKWPTMTASHLDAIGIVTLTSTIGDLTDEVVHAGTVPDMDAATELLRQSNLFSLIEWSAPVLRIPNQSWPPVEVTDSILAPECLRTHTRGRRDDHELTTSPAFPAPIGPGALAATPVCE